jgi:hypothetical protein
VPITMASNFGLEREPSMRPTLCRLPVTCE